MSKSVRSIRFQLIAAVNAVLLLFVILFLIVDYIRELSQRINDKKISLQEEAKTLLPGVIHLQGHGREVIQTYVDNVCGQMEDTDSPSHHIAIEIDGDLIQAHAHHRASEELVTAMRRAADSDGHRIRTDNLDLVVGTLTDGNASVFVSEDISKIRTEVFKDEIRRMWGLILLGLVGAGIVNFLLVRMVSRPLQILVNKVREVGGRDFATEVGELGSSELNYLSSEINAMSRALQAFERERNTRLEKARKIQENLLPKNTEMSHMSVGMIYRPAEEVGGDYFDILPHGKDGWLICMADATDHGVPAAMSAAMLKTLLLQTKVHANSPASILKQMNRVFMEVNLYGDFASIILLRIDLQEKTLAYANAGHDPAWLIENGKARELPATGTLLGILEDGDWEDVIIQLSGHSRIAISTDGITETFNSEEKAFGKQRLLKLLLQHSSMSATDTAEFVRSKVIEFRGDAKQTDDVTLLLLDLVLKQSDIPSNVNAQSENRSRNGQESPAASHPVVADRNTKAVE